MQDYPFPELPTLLDGSNVLGKLELIQEKPSAIKEVSSLR